MGSPDEPKREIESLRDRISGLSAAMLRISASLDVNTVLRDIVESARALTGARSIPVRPGRVPVVRWNPMLNGGCNEGNHRQRIP